jgi:hypothetical protein
MPWTGQVQSSETYVPNEPAAVALWGEQGVEGEAYLKNERYALVLDNEGERIFSIDGLPVLSVLTIETLWIKQVVEGKTWIGQG